MGVNLKLVGRRGLVWRELATLIFVIIVIILAFFVFVKINLVRDAILSFFG